MKHHRKNGFTLVEIMVVVVIIGLLSAIAIPAFDSVRQSSQNSRFASDVRTYTGAIETFALETGIYPEDSNTGAIPTGLGSYISTGNWNESPSIGGSWDVEKDSYGVASAVGVVDFTASPTQLARFDKKFYDGNVSTGAYRLLASNRYYYIIAE